MDQFLSDTSGCYHISARTISNEFDLFKSIFTKHTVELVFFIVTQEMGTVEKNLHFHYHLSIRSKLKLESIMNYLRKALHAHYDHRNYYVSKVRKDFGHLVYITKECESVDNMKSIHSNLPAALHEDLLKENLAIEHDKKLPMFKKLYLRYNSEHGEQGENYLHDSRDIRLYILQCYKDWDILFPNRSQMLQYTAYIKAQYCSLTLVHDECYKYFN